MLAQPCYGSCPSWWCGLPARRSGRYRSVVPVNHERAVFLTLPAIAEKQRRAEQELWREFEMGRPRILGALPAAAHGLREPPSPVDIKTSVILCFDA
jgi:hypothetical protein